MSRAKLALDVGFFLDPSNPTAHDASFARASTAYKSDGSQVAANTPRFEWGVFHNFVLNPSFETDGNGDGLADNWSIYANWQSYSRVPGLFGSYAQRGVANGVTAAPRFMSDHVRTTPGRTYTASVYGRAPTGRYLLVYIKGFNAAGAETWQGPQKSVVATGDWQRLELGFTPPTDGTAVTTKLLVGLTYTPPAGTTADFDGAQVEEGSVAREWRDYGPGAVMVEEGTTNLLTANQSSVETDTTGFGAAWSGSLSRDTMQYLHGNASLKCSLATAGNRQGWAASVNASAAAGETFTASVWLKADANLDGKLCDVRFGVDGTTYSQVTVTLTQSWQRVAVSYMFASAVTSMYLYAGTVNGTGVPAGAAFWTDMLQVEKKPYPTSWALGSSTRSPETLTIPTAGVLSPSEGTIECWVYVNDVVKDNSFARRVFRVVRPTGDGNAIQLFHAGGWWYAETKDDAGNATSVGCSDSFTPNGWHHFAVTWSVARLALLIDGQLRGSANSPYLSSTFTGLAYIGSRDLGNQLGSLIDDLRISSRARTDEEIAAAYASGKPLAYDQYTTYLLRLDGDLSHLGGAFRNLYGLVRARQGLAFSRGRDQARALTQPMAGSLDAELDNRSRDFSAENASSPYAGELYAGKDVRLWADVNGERLGQWAGFTEDWVQHPHPEQLSVGMPCIGTLSRLRGVLVTTGLYENVRTDEAIAVVLDAAGWPSERRRLDMGRTVLRYWWLAEADAFEAVRTLMFTEGPGADLYEGPDGEIVFESRHYRILQVRCKEVQATIRDADNGADYYFVKGFDYRTGITDIVNVCSVTCKERAVGSLQPVWSYGAQIALGAEEARSFIASMSDPVKNAVAPVGGTDYTVLSGTVASAVIDRTSGSRITITITAGSGGAVIQGLQLRAQPVQVVSTVQVSNRIDTSASQSRHGKRSFTLPVWPEIDPNVAQDFCDAVVSRYRDPRPTVVIPVVGNDDEQLEMILRREVSDRVRIVEAQTGVDDDYWIEAIAARVTEAGMEHRVAFACEKTIDLDWGIWDESRWDACVWGY